MIRQTISCDICGAEKKETNHWFVALEQSGELRLGTWATFGKGRSGSKHLCGQTCLHKLVDDFMAGAMGIRPLSVDEEDTADSPGSAEVAGWGASGTTKPEATVNYDREHGEFESSARLIPTPEAGTRAARSTSAASSRAPSIRREAKSVPAARVIAAHVAESKATARAAFVASNASQRQKSAIEVSTRAVTPRATALSVVGLSSTQPQIVPASPVSLQSQAAELAMTARETAAAVSKADRELTLQRRRAEAWERERARESRQLGRQMNPMLRPRVLEA
uniref:Uncharacterized protein n=1 Tax=mine drainage metagenome TaxID=410659 RepID=E6PYB5_9ZZZZ